MKITICGSMKFHKKMREVKRILEELNYQVLVPKDADIEDMIPVEAREGVSNSDIIAAKIEYDYIREHFRKIEKADAILVLNYEKNGIAGYIGGNTFLEMGYAFGLGKGIYLMNPVPEMNYSGEMHAMKPIVIEGDLGKIM